MGESSRVREVRRAKSLTMKQFGEMIGISDAAVSQIENEKTRMSDQTRRSICREFNVSEEWLRTGEGDMFIQMSRSEEIAGFLGDVLKDDGSFRMRLISVLSRLSPDEWVLLEQMANKLATETGKDDL